MDPAVLVKHTTQLELAIAMFRISQKHTDQVHFLILVTELILELILNAEEETIRVIKVMVLSIQYRKL